MTGKTRPIVPEKFTRIIGVGLPKTGTTTLASMLRQLGFDHAPYDAHLITAVAGGDFSALGQALAEHQSFEDWPWPLVYREVAKLAPGAGFHPYSSSVAADLA
jgi:hypothetical protein